jgi:alpha/beta superfamily hydrolase
MTTTSVQIANGNLTLEGALYRPDGSSNALVVVCHPHPLRGGDMHNNVVMSIVRAVYDRGIPALAFNFRGVGASEGVHDKGIGEREDVQAALGFAARCDGIRRLGLAGYSFGGRVAAAAVDGSVSALALVSAPSAGLAEETNLPEFSGPVLMIAGDADHVSSLEALRQAASALGANAEVVGVPGADHFWWGHEAILQETVGGFFARAMSED